MRINCKCCQKEIIKIANMKFCGNCANYVTKLNHKIGKLKYDLRKLKIEVYGTYDKRMVKLIKK